jgi:hypothetical protein
MGSPVIRSRHVLKKNSLRFAGALLAALAGVVAGPTAAPNIMIRHRASTD